MSPSDTKKSKSGGSKSRRPSQVGGARLSESQKRQQAYEAEYDEYTAAPSSSRPSASAASKKKGKGPQQQQMGMPMGGYGGQMQNGNLNNEQLKFCKEVIKELFKKQHSPFAYPFYEPVGQCFQSI